MARRAGLPYYETSAVTGEGVRDAWDGLILAVKASLSAPGVRDAVVAARAPAAVARGHAAATAASGDDDATDIAGTQDRPSRCPCST
jgi:hypothetical protein